MPNIFESKSTDFGGILSSVKGKPNNLRFIFHAEPSGAELLPCSDSYIVTEGPGDMHIYE